MNDAVAPRPEGSRPEVVRWRLRVAYDGSGFRGFAAQDGQPTVGGALSEALSLATRVEVSLTCAGRTDAGVHALDQVVHFDLPAPVASGLDPAAVMRSVNRQLAPSIVIREAGEVPLTFSAR
ncbi:MAG TPA: hypothetical protein VHT49_05175, partial [Acidimicrobiales bacterium]|nr:hypothetical protein [Acidimicrobiales bacterium]